MPQKTEIDNLFVFTNVTIFFCLSSKKIEYKVRVTHISDATNNFLPTRDFKNIIFLANLYFPGDIKGKWKRPTSGSVALFAVWAAIFKK